MAEIRRTVGENLQIPAAVRTARGNHRAAEWRTNANLMAVFRHAPGNTFAFDVLAGVGQLNGVGMANQVIGKFIEPNRIGAIPFRADPCVAAMIKQLVGVVDRDTLRGALAGKAANCG